MHQCTITACADQLNNARAASALNGAVSGRNASVHLAQCKLQLLLSLVKAAHRNICESGTNALESTNALENHFLPRVNSQGYQKHNIQYSIFML